MHNQSITLKLDLPKFDIKGTVTDEKGDLLVIVKANSLPACPVAGGRICRYMIGESTGSKIGRCGSSASFYSARNGDSVARTVAYCFLSSTRR